MSSAQSVNQDSTIQPARRGQGIAITVSGSSIAYDLSKVPWNGMQFTPLRNVSVMLTLRNDGVNPIYYLFGSTNDADLDETFVQTPGSTLALNSVVPELLPVGQRVSVLINRPDDLFLQLKATGGTSVCRIFATSPNSPDGISR